MTSQPRPEEDAARPEVCVQPDLEGLCHAAAEAFVQLANVAISQRGGLLLALSGGRTAPRFYATLAEEHYRNRVPWEKVHVFWSDERYVPPDSEQSNYWAAKRNLLDYVNIPPEQIHPMPTLLPSPVEAAEAYEEELIFWFGGQTPRFDLLIMGMGEEGHTASLFPHSPALTDEYAAHLVVAVEVPAQPPQRLTMTLPVFNNGENLWFLISGAAKHEALDRAVTGPADAWECPASGVRPSNGTVMWWVDEDAFTGRR